MSDEATIAIAIFLLLMLLLAVLSYFGYDSWGEGYP